MNKARALARTAEAAENQSKFLAMVNAKLDLLLKANKLEFDEATFFGEAPAVEEVAPEEVKEPADTGGETALTDGVQAVEASSTSKKK